MFARTARHLLFLLLLPAIATGSELTLKTDVDGEGGFPTVWYGLAPANGYFGVLGLRLDGERVEAEIAGTVTFESGPLLSLDVEAGDGEFTPDVSTYRYAPGTFIMDVEWVNAQGVPRHGLYVAPLLALEIVTCEGCDANELSYGVFTAALGEGRFDRRLSNLLDVARRAPAGMFSGALDQISGTPATGLRFAGAPGAWDASIDVSLPEPGVGGLLAAGAVVAWLARVRRRSA